MIFISTRFLFYFYQPFHKNLAQNQKKNDENEETIKSYFNREFK